MDSDNIIIRNAVPKDIPNIVKLHRNTVKTTNSKYYNKDVINEWLSQITNDSVKTQFKVTTTNWAISTQNDILTGFCQFTLPKSTIYQINVLPVFQGKGIGKALYLYIESEFLKNGKDVIKLNSTINAVKFYEKLGFKSTGSIIFKLINTEMDMYTMEKRL